MLKVTRLDHDSTLQEAIDAVHEFNIFCEENDLHGNYEHNAANVNKKELEEKNKVLEKIAKTVFKHWTSLSKDALRTN